MDTFKSIQKKLHQFSKRYYTNELLKGTIFFFALGFIYLFCILFVEHFLWLQPFARTVLFALFVLVELFLLVRFIVVPIFKLMGLRKGISLQKASTIIGNHFPEVKDKLLNVLQLKESQHSSDLIAASIQQKANDLEPVPFVKAVNFKENISYLKYATIPIFIWVVVLLTGINEDITKSLHRVVHYTTAYVPPALFTFFIENKNLQVIQGKPFTVAFKTTGKVTPATAKIVFNNQEYYLQSKGNGTFDYIFSEVNKPFDFYVKANGIRSQKYSLQVLYTPTIQDVSMLLKYPTYVGKRNENIHSTGNVTVPEGTNIAWNVKTNQTGVLDFITQKKRIPFVKKAKDYFEFSKRIVTPINYQIKSSNTNLQDYENLEFSIQVIKDEFPNITVTSDIDSISYGMAQFAGQISDDYGIKKLQLVYYDEDNPNLKNSHSLKINKENVQPFYYQFPEGVTLETGINYGLFFQVYDNDAVNGSKKTVSQTFYYRKKTTEEIDQELLEEQKETLQGLEKTLQKQQHQEKEFQKIQLHLQEKKNMRWNDKKKVQDFVKRQEQYKQMMQRQTEKLQENLEDKKEQHKSLQEKKEALKNRIEELKKLDKQEKLLKEIEKMAEKLNKEDLLKKAKELAQQNKQQQRSLTRILELTKRFYIEQKTMQIADKLEKLAKEQALVQQKTEGDLEAQNEIKKAFSDIEKELEELQKENKKLKEPMELPDTEDEKAAINEDLKKAEESLEKQEPAKAKKSQQKTAKKMKAMSAKMKKAMADMQGESIEENMDDLRKILENLIAFSFQQENLMTTFESISVAHPTFGEKLKKQNEIKTYFEHIDDSLYVLAMRLPTLSTKIKDDLSSAHYHLDQSLENFSENRFPNGVSNQRYVMTAANNLADYLSTILNNMKNSMSMKPGEGKGDTPSFSLPDLIEKQKGLGKKMEKGMKKPGEKTGEKGEKTPGGKGKKGEKGKNGKSGKGDKEGGSEKGKGKGENKGRGENEDLNGELYQIYKEQSELRQQLEAAIKASEKAGNGNAAAKKVLKSMEQLEQEILEKGFNGATLQKMQALNYQLLKLDKAALKQGKEKQRKGTTNLESYQKRKLKALQFQQLFYNQTEILNRQSLPLQENYKKKVQEYFKKEAQ